MKPLERVLAALAHEPPYRCPMQINFISEFAARLKKEMGMCRQAVSDSRADFLSYGFRLS